MSVVWVWVCSHKGDLSLAVARYWGVASQTSVLQSFDGRISYQEQLARGRNLSLASNCGPCPALWLRGLSCPVSPVKGSLECSISPAPHCDFSTSFLSLRHCLPRNESAKNDLGRGKAQGILETA